MAENVVDMLMVGVVIPSASFIIVCVAIWLKDHAKKWQRDAFAPGVIFIDVTQIATDLVPLMRQLVRDHGKDLQVRTFGVDGAYFATFTAWLWNWMIKRSLRKGARVEYVLCEELDSKARQSLSKLLNWSSSKGHELYVHVLPASRADAVDAQLSEMRTRHPTLFTLPNGSRAMWLEGKHREGGKYAYNVRYVSPRAMAGRWEEEFFRQSDMLDAIVAECQPLAPRVA